MEGLSAAELFIKYDFVETRDILKTFLTLVSGTLVISLAFSDKIVRPHEASRRVQYLMVGAWLGLLLAFIAGGAAIFVIMEAAGCAVYIRDMAQCYPTAWIAWSAATFAGCVYVLAMLSMIAAAARAIFSPGE